MAPKLAWLAAMLVLLPVVPLVAADGYASCGPFPLPGGPHTCQLQQENAPSYLAVFGLTADPATGHGSFAGQLLVTGTNGGFFLEDCSGTAQGTSGSTECHTCAAGLPAQGTITANYTAGAYVPPAQLCTPATMAQLLPPVASGGEGAWTGILLVPGPG